MFENIIGQDRIVNELEKAVKENSLPGAILFSGDNYSGKLTTALELARILTCSGDGEWNCGCSSCESHRLMLHPYTQMLGTRYFMDEITACADVLKRTDRQFARFMFIRSVRKLLRRFDPVLWDGSESKFKQISSGAAKAEELLRDIPTEGELPPAEKTAKLLDRIISECAGITDSFSSDNIPIDQIRRISAWAHTSSVSRKVVILENADAMGEASRNSLLKILEEPPQGCCFILTTARKGAIIPTILSRLRVYNFAPRTEEDSALVISRIFRDEPGQYRNMREYFLGRDGDIGRLRQAAADFVSAAVNHKPASAAADLSAVSSSKRLFRLFVEEIAGELRTLLVSGSLSAPDVAGCNAELKEAVAAREQYNQSAQLVLEKLYYRMRRIL